MLSSLSTLRGVALLLSQARDSLPISTRNVAKDGNWSSFFAPSQSPCTIVLAISEPEFEVFGVVCCTSTMTFSCPKNLHHSRHKWNTTVRQVANTNGWLPVWHERRKEKKTKTLRFQASGVAEIKTVPRHFARANQADRCITLLYCAQRLTP